MAHDSGLLDRPSPDPVDVTVERLTELLRAKGITLFAVIDHDGEAARVGLSMRPTKLLIFGNPRAGTPVMQAAARSAIDLPLKILVWEDAAGRTWMTTNSPEYLRARHGLGEQFQAVLAGAPAIADAISSGG